jgi:hypothetical protein
MKVSGIEIADTFRWKVARLGAPNFFAKSGASAAMAKVFREFADAALKNESYKRAKRRIATSAHQAETKKAALQVFGLLYVRPNSDRISVTPLGGQVLAVLKSGIPYEDKRNTILTLLCWGLCNYQFDNPLPVGGKQSIEEYAESNPRIDILPYYAIYKVLLECGGKLLWDELYGLIFGLRYSVQIPEAIDAILKKRKRGKTFLPLPPFPDKRENTRIYFMSHASLDSELMERIGQDYVITRRGQFIIPKVLDETERRRAR